MRSEIEERMEMAFELCELAEAMLREKLRQASPPLSTEEIEARIDAWYMQRPGAERGDAEGREVPWPRQRP
jgi:hypothetical protein